MKINEKQFVECICDRYGIHENDFSLENDFKEMGIDSLSIFSLIDNIEEDFNLIIDINDITIFKKPYQLLNYINETK